MNVLNPQVHIKRRMHNSDLSTAFNSRILKLAVLVSGIFTGVIIAVHYLAPTVEYLTQLLP